MDTARHQFKLTVPDDICVIGFDYIEQCSWSSYDLTTFAQPVDQIAKEAVSWLTHPAKTDSIASQISPELVWRGSVRGG